MSDDFLKYRFVRSSPASVHGEVGAILEFQGPRGDVLELFVDHTEASGIFASIRRARLGDIAIRIGGPTLL